MAFAIRPLQRLADGLAYVRVRLRGLYGSYRRADTSVKKVFIPFDDFSRTGGPTTFMHNLQGALDAAGFEYSRDLRRSSAVFFPISYNIRALRKFKEAGGKVIQRLDGLHYPEKHGAKHVALNSNIKRIYRDYADFVVFQSEYCRKQCFALLGEKDDASYAVIVNGADQRRFHPKPNKDLRKPDRIRFITTGTFRNVDMLAPLIEALDLLRHDIAFTFTIVGPVRNDKLKCYLERDYVHNLGERSPAEVADALRNSDAYLFSSVNPPCPNSMIEAISTGLPVVAFDDGSAPELLHFSADLLAPTTGGLIKRCEDLSPSRLAEKIALLVADWDKYVALSVENSGAYSFDATASEYIDVFRKFSQ